MILLILIIPNNGPLLIEIWSFKYGKIKVPARSIFLIPSILIKKILSIIWKSTNFGKIIITKLLHRRWYFRPAKITFVCKNILTIFFWKIYPPDYLISTNGFLLKNVLVCLLSFFLLWRLSVLNSVLFFSMKTWLDLHRQEKSKYGLVTIFLLASLHSWCLRECLIANHLIEVFKIRKECFNAYHKYLGLSVIGEQILFR